MFNAGPGREIQGSDLDSDAPRDPWSCPSPARSPVPYARAWPSSRPGRERTHPGRRANPPAATERTHPQSRVTTAKSSGGCRYHRVAARAHPPGARTNPFSGAERIINAFWDTRPHEDGGDKDVGALGKGLPCRDSSRDRASPTLPRLPIMRIFRAIHSRAGRGDVREEGRPAIRSRGPGSSRGLPRRPRGAGRTRHGSPRHRGGSTWTGPGKPRGPGPC